MKKHLAFRMVIFPLTLIGMPIFLFVCVLFLMILATPYALFLAFASDAYLDEVLKDKSKEAKEDPCPESTH